MYLYFFLNYALYRKNEQTLTFFFNGPKVPKHFNTLYNLKYNTIVLYKRLKGSKLNF